MNTPFTAYSLRTVCWKHCRALSVAWEWNVQDLGAGFHLGVQWFDGVHVFMFKHLLVFMLLLIYIYIVIMHIGVICACIIILNESTWMIYTCPIYVHYSLNFVVSGGQSRRRTCGYRRKGTAADISISCHGATLPKWGAIWSRRSRCLNFLIKCRKCRLKIHEIHDIYQTCWCLLNIHDI